MVMSKKGQALVEFIIILPVFLMLLLAVFDYVKIIQTKMDEVLWIKYNEQEDR